MWWKEESEKLSPSQYIKLHLRFSGKKNFESLVISKRLKYPKDDRTDTIFYSAAKNVSLEI